MATQTQVIKRQAALSATGIGENFIEKVKDIFAAVNQALGFRSVPGSLSLMHEEKGAELSHMDRAICDHIEAARPSSRLGANSQLFQSFGFTPPGNPHVTGRFRQTAIGPEDSEALGLKM